MAKLTLEEINVTKIVRATLSNGLWTVLVKGDDNKIYHVRFAGVEGDADATILENTHTALLDVDKYVPPILPVNVERKAIYGIAPSGATS